MTFSNKMAYTYRHIVKLNKIYINFPDEYSAENIPFLDLKVWLKNGNVTTDFYVKPTDHHQYLHFPSAHLNHTKQVIVFTQTFCISRLCSNESGFEWNNEKTRFVKREYPGKLMDYEIRKLKFTIKETNRKSKSKNGAPFVVTYHALLNSTDGIIKKNLYLNMDQRLKKCSVNRPWCFFVASRN